VNEGQGEKPPALTVDRSAVAAFGGFQRAAGGVARGRALADAAADSAEQTAWRRARGEVIHRRRADADAC
jgi:hypothetical protein